ncbi:MAG: N-acetylmuramoyl-L-alanine amidase [Candidatus Cloacimonadaceae bacterium]|jgi:N-acetylmuramoyl-L-alanine amidase|nr:N-acetylmuramoyl-L-alanine amidase [Candidatus Cloacimonadota bacterium]MDX9950040.1 N-acetylmuramoyl-L-alanine amidase [Candidatus Syntrophosphaera sp.]NLN84560.1 N-acetylmuramoyl-L-alanine amidase [Candidatus Cloacimonadota bacterium]
MNYKLTKILPILMGCLLAIGLLEADVNILLMPTKLPKKLSTVRLENRDYVALEEVNKLLHTVARVEYSEYSDHRVYFWLNGQQFNFLLNSSFYSFGENVFNMQYPFLQDGDEHYLPAHFFKNCLPRHFPATVQLVDDVLQMPTPQDRGVLRVVLDPGHGGKDPGAVGKNKVREKDLNLSVALFLRTMLQQELGVEVLMTRSEDVYMSLSSRTKFATDRKADIFVSIHTNASTNRSAKGIETYYLSTRSTTDSRAVEALENGVVELYEGAEAQKKYDALDFILSDMSQTEYLESSNTLASLVQRNMVSGSQGKDRGVKQANFYVLRGAFMPAILVEMGFISNPEEEALLANPEYQERMARTIFEGIKRFKHNYDRVRKIG